MNKRKVEVIDYAKEIVAAIRKVIYRQLQDLNLYLPEIKEKFYPQDVDSSNCWANKDASYTIFGEIVNTYVIE